MLAVELVYGDVLPLSAESAAYWPRYVVLAVAVKKRWSWLEDTIPTLFLLAAIVKDKALVMCWDLGMRVLYFWTAASCEQRTSSIPLRRANSVALQRFRILSC